MGARRRVVFIFPSDNGAMRGSNKRKVFGQAFSKRLAVSKGSAFGRPSQRAKSFFRRALRKGLNLQNDPVDRFAKRGNPAREGSPLLANFTNYPFTEQVKTAYLDLVSSRLTARKALQKVLICTPIRRGLPFARAKGSKTRSGRPRDPRRLTALDTDIVFLQQQKNKSVLRADALQR